MLCAVSRQHERSDFPSAAAVTAKGPAVSRRERATHGQRCVLQRLERLGLPAGPQNGGARVSQVTQLRMAREDMADVSGHSVARHEEKAPGP